MKNLICIVGILFFSNLFSQNYILYKGIESDLKNSSKSLDIAIRLPNSFEQISLMDTKYLVDKVSDPCIFIDSNSDQNVKIVEILIKYNLLDKTYWYEFDNDDFVDKATDHIVPFEQVKIYLAINFETPGHYDIIYLPITNYEIAKNVIYEISQNFDQTECFNRFGQKIKE